MAGQRASNSGFTQGTRSKQAKQKGKAKGSSRNPFSKVKGKQGALAAFAQVPLDVLTEICSQVDHETLYILSLTLRVFRSVLLSPFAKSIWLKARKEVGLPVLECEDMEEWQLAELIWGKTCQGGCGKIFKGSKRTEFSLRLRMCSSCYSRNVCTNNKRPPGLCALTMECCISPDELDSWKRPKEYPISSLNHIENYIVTEFYSKEPDPEEVFQLRKFDHWQTGMPYHDGEGDIMRILEGTHFDAPRDGPATAKATWVWDKIHYNAARRRDGALLRTWADRQEAAKAKARDHTRCERKMQIESRLRAELDHDWGVSDFTDYEWSKGDLKFLKDPKLITDKIWANIVPQIHAHLISRRAIRDYGQSKT